MSFTSFRNFSPTLLLSTVNLGHSRVRDSLEGSDSCGVRYGCIASLSPSQSEEKRPQYLCQEGLGFSKREEEVGCVGRGMMGRGKKRMRERERMNETIIET